MDQVFEAVYLLEITPAIVDQAAMADPPLWRSLDAIHLATALSIGDPELEVITYDNRFADAARANPLAVIQPGRPREPRRRPTPHPLRRLAAPAG